jgi:hypothetical protein
MRKQQQQLARPKSRRGIPTSSCTSYVCGCGGWLAGWLAGWLLWAGVCLSWREVRWQAACGHAGYSRTVNGIIGWMLYVVLQ